MRIITLQTKNPMQCLFLVAFIFHLTTHALSPDQEGDAICANCKENSFENLHKLEGVSCAIHSPTWSLDDLAVQGILSDMEALCSQTNCNGIFYDSLDISLRGISKADCLSSSNVAIWSTVTCHSDEEAVNEDDKCQIRECSAGTINSCSGDFCYSSTLGDQSTRDVLEHCYDRFVSVM